MKIKVDKEKKQEKKNKEKKKIRKRKELRGRFKIYIAYKIRERVSQIQVPQLECFDFAGVLLVIMLPSFLRNIHQTDFLFLIRFGLTGLDSNYVVPVHPIFAYVSILLSFYHTLLQYKSWEQKPIQKPFRQAFHCLFLKLLKALSVSLNVKNSQIFSLLKIKYQQWLCQFRF